MSRLTSTAAAILLQIFGFSFAMQIKDKIHHTEKLGDIAAMARCIQNNPDSLNERDTYGYTPLHIATNNCDTKMAEHLLSYPDIEANLGDNYGLTPLHHAALSNCVALVKALLNFPGIQVNKQCNRKSTALHWAAMQGHQIEILGLLLADKRVELNIQDDLGRTPFFMASYFGNIPGAQLLYKHHADITIKGHNVFSPLHFYAGRKAVDSLKPETTQ